MARELRKVLIEVGDDEVVVTFALGEPVPGPVEWATYAAQVYNPNGDGGKQFGVRLGIEKTSAHIADFGSRTTQANYDGSYVEISDSTIIVRYRDASLGVSLGGTSRAFLAINGQDVNTDVPVTVID
jgi:hypothetical protein